MFENLQDGTDATAGLIGQLTGQGSKSKSGKNNGILNSLFGGH